MMMADLPPAADAMSIVDVGSISVSLQQNNIQGFVLFGDSWFDPGIAANYRPWPVQLAEKLKLPVYSYACHQSQSSSLGSQLERACAEVPKEQRPNLLCLIHTGGNDFIGAEKNYNPFARRNCWPWWITGGFNRRLKGVLGNIETHIDELVAAGFRSFGVADIPFTSSIPVLWIAVLVRINYRGRRADRDLDELAERVQARHGGVMCTRFNTRSVLEREVTERRRSRLRSCLRARCCRQRREPLFLGDSFHPSNYLHGQMAEVFMRQIRSSIAQSPAESTTSVPDSSRSTRSASTEQYEDLSQHFLPRRG
jgi:hypothetical protein